MRVFLGKAEESLKVTEVFHNVLDDVDVQCMLYAIAFICSVPFDSWRLTRDMRCGTSSAIH